MITFEEYQSLGGVCDLTAFNRTIDRANGVINNATFGRVSAMREIPRQVKACLRDVIEYIHENTTVTTISSRSQSAGGVSESETYNVKHADVQSQELHDIVSDHLLFVRDDNGTPLLYRGCMK